jgi:hypothetical protein
MSANVMILEIANGKATVGYQDTIRVIFPKKSPPEGAMEGQDTQMYGGTLDAFSSEIGERMVRHQVEQGDDE